jgi:small subunit ribosomal protein S15
VQAVVEEDEIDMSEIYEDSADFPIDYARIAEVEEMEARRKASAPVSAAARNKVLTRSAVERWRRHETDVGSAEAQVAVANERIKYLTAHLLSNRKDLSAKRGLQALVVARRKFLSYLSRSDPDKARLLSEELGIRFRASSGQDWDRAARYGAFKNTKSESAGMKAAPGKGATSSTGRK